MTPEISERLAELRRQFADQLPKRLEALRAQFLRLQPSQWEPSEAEVLHRLIHSLTGLAGTFGMQSVSLAARDAETALVRALKSGKEPSTAEWQAIGAALERVDQLARIRLSTSAPVLHQRPQTQRLDHSPLIHLVEDDADQAEHMSQLLLESGYRTRVFTEPAAFRAAHLEQGAEVPAAVVMDMIFPESDAAGAALIAELGLGKDARVSVVVVSVRDDLQARLAAFRAGACRYLVKPVEPGHLTDLLDGLTGRQPNEPYRVLLVDDDALFLEAQAAVLEAAGMNVRKCSEPLKILDTLSEFRPDVVVLDVYMPEVTGPELAAVLRESESQAQLPILFLSAETDMSEQLLALNLGGDDFLIKPVQPDHLVAAVSARARRARQNSVVARRLENTLYEREREHLALDQHAIVSIADHAGNITYVNNKFCEISGYSRAELIGKNHRVVKSGEHPPEFYADLWRTIRCGEVWQGEICNQRKNGTPYWVESTITPFVNEGGKPYQYVSIRTDISHVKTAERALRESEERLRRGQLFANIGSWEWDLGSGEVYWSERMGPLLGYPEGELHPSYDNYIAAVHPHDRQAVIDAVTASIETDAPYDIEHRVTWPDGTIRWMLERGAVVHDAEGKAVKMLGVGIDIDERKTAEQAMFEARREADRANQAKSEFLSSMSHELRTPMNAILGFGQIMQYDDTLTAEHQDSVREIVKAGRHLLDLINEVLDLAKIESGHLQLSIESVELTPIVEECLSLVVTLAAKRDIQINHRIVPAAQVHADRTRLKQILLNLLSNAIKYNRKGGSVKLDVQPVDAKMMRILVTDTGPGIPAERLAELFQPFNRLGAEATEVEGTGIGLTITQRITEMMGGTLNVHSELGVGSSFWIDLPIGSAPAVEPHVPHPEPGDSSAPLTTHMRKHTVVYIEDNPANLRLVTQILGRRPHVHLLTAHTAELGIELIMTRKPELILLDINMPGQDGYELLRLIKGQELTRAIPMVAITANAMKRDMERGMAAGFSDYLTKPLDIGKFNAVVDRWLDTGNAEESRNGP